MLVSHRTTEHPPRQKQYEEATGEPFDPPKAGGGKKKAAAASDSGKASKKAKAVASQGDEEGAEIATKDRASLVIAPRDENYSQWYLDVIAAADLVDNSPVKGCMVIKPYGMVRALRCWACAMCPACRPAGLPVSITPQRAHAPLLSSAPLWTQALWDALREELDKRIKASGAQNAYFPLFIPRSFLSKEAEHVEGFAKECAVVTHHR